jgi:hypothetical protein
VIVIEMVNRLMKQITIHIHQAGAELIYVNRNIDEAETGLLHIFVTDKLKQAATQPLSSMVF